MTVAAAAGRLSVSDTGPGLELDDLPRAFDRFFLYDKYGRERPVGSGLGLAIVKQLAEAMGGTVAVASAPGEGATFTLTLPGLARRRGEPSTAVRGSSRLGTRLAQAQGRKCEVSTTSKSAPVSAAEAVQVVVRPARIGRARDVPGRAVVGEDHPVALERLEHDARLRREAADVEARLEPDAQAHRRQRRVVRVARVVARRVDVGAAASAAR